MENRENSFDRLVSGLSASERQSMLEKMKNIRVDPEREDLQSMDPGAGGTPIPVQLRSESLLFRIILWIRSLFSNTNIEELYNEHKVSQIARHIEHEFPGLIDCKRGFFLSTFYDKLQELKKCAMFFRSYTDFVEESPGDFSVFLGSLILPDITLSMESDVDPYRNSLDEGPRPELRAMLLRRMDDIIDHMENTQKAAMYNASRAVSWLSSFSRLPFDRVLHSFTNYSGAGNRCAYGQLTNEFAVFARVLCNGIKIPEEVLEAAFMFTANKIQRTAVVDGLGETDASTDFIQKAHSMLSMMHMFITTVPFNSLGCVVYNDCQWQCDELGGGEDWLSQYKSGWKVLFDQKWESWLRDCKVEVIRKSLGKVFNIQVFPKLPSRPWTNLYGNVKFHYELTAGFLSWYFRELFPTQEIFLKTVMVEGDFAKKENRDEYTEAFNALVQASIMLSDLRRRLADNGDLGIGFSKLTPDKMRSIQGRGKADVYMREVETTVSDVVFSFGEAARKLDLVMKGIFNESSDIHYDTLTNLYKIQGGANAAFRDKLRGARDSVMNALMLVKELESIDSPRSK